MERLTGGRKWSAIVLKDAAFVSRRAPSNLVHEANVRHSRVAIYHRSIKVPIWESCLHMVVSSKSEIGQNFSAEDFPSGEDASPEARRVMTSSRPHLSIVNRVGNEQNMSSLGRTTVCHVQTNFGRLLLPCSEEAASKHNRCARLTAATVNQKEQSCNVSMAGTIPSASCRR